MFRTLLSFAACVVLVCAATASAQAPARYEIDNVPSYVRLSTESDGWMSLPGFESDQEFTSLSGYVAVDTAAGAPSGLRLVIQADSLIVISDHSGMVREKILTSTLEETMETHLYPEIVFESSDIQTGAQMDGGRRVRVNGTLSLHGVTKPVEARGWASAAGDSVVVEGSLSILHTDFDMVPKSMMGGAGRVADRLALSFRLVGRSE